MSWTTIETSAVKSRLATAELNALRSLQLAEGQADPLEEVIQRVVQEVRGYVATCPQNRLSTGQTVPSSLKDAALALIRYRLATRLPVRSLLTEERKEEGRDALTLLRRVADCKFVIDQPDDPEDSNVGGTAAQNLNPQKQNFSRDSLNGL